MWPHVLEFTKFGEHTPKIIRVLSDDPLFGIKHVCQFWHDWQQHGVRFGIDSFHPSTHALEVGSLQTWHQTGCPYLVHKHDKETGTFSEYVPEDAAITPASLASIMSPGDVHFSGGPYFIGLWQIDLEDGKAHVSFYVKSRDQYFPFCTVNNHGELKQLLQLNKILER